MGSGMGMVWEQKHEKLINNRWEWEKGKILARVALKRTQSIRYRQS